MKIIKYLSFVVIISVLCAFNYKQSKGTDMFFWEKNVKLTWNNYKGSPNGNTEGLSAVTNYHIKTTSHYFGDSVEYVIKCYLSMQASWVKKEDQNDKVLHHEQGHFDIGEIFARKIRKAVSGFAFKMETLNKDYNTLFQNLMKECDTYDELYDSETNKSENAEKQKEWDQKIDKELKDLEGYSGWIVKVRPN
jgi:hypothetical protein